MSVEVPDALIAQEPQRPLIVVPWPRYPRTTPKGVPSHAKNAGHLVPWLSANVVNNLAHPVYRAAVRHWREAARRTGEATSPLPAGRYLVGASLRTATDHPMDPFSVLEGCKPVIDGLVLAGFLRDDTRETILGGTGSSCKAAERRFCALILYFRPVQ